ncbi:MAG: hypothetical protein CVU98_07175 [Firmicutes bacterium HGW-Firmicutes-3]|jgi:hypothetical protein|nr:MAG: hypothetical protein CVU98_07175 [Firmicutes bacterium HGW-Firmicutes-3]
MKKWTIVLALIILVFLGLVGCSRVHQSDDGEAQTENEEGKINYVTEDMEITSSNEAEEKISEPEFFYLTGVQDPVSQLWGYINTDGEYVIQPQFAEISSFQSEGIARVRDTSQLFGYIDITGNYIVEPQFLECGGFYDSGLAMVRDTTYKLGFIDLQGNLVVEPRYDNVGDLDDELIVVGSFASEGGILYGYMDRTGKEVIGLQYRYAESFDKDGIAVVVDAESDLAGYIDTQGNYIIQPTYPIFNGAIVGAQPFTDEGIAAVYDGGYWGYIDKTGKYKISPQFGYAESMFRNIKLTPARPTGADSYYFGSGWGFIDKTGNYVIEPQFMEVKAFNEEGLAMVLGENGYWGYIDLEGKYVVPPIFSYLGEFHMEEMATIARDANGLYGYIDKNGLYVIQPIFEGFNSFSDNGLACVQDSETSYYGYINRKGEYVIQPTFKKAYGFHNKGLVMVQDASTELYGYIDETGKYVVEPKYLDVEIYFSKIYVKKE